MRAFSALLLLTLSLGLLAEEGGGVIRYVDEDSDRTPMHTVVPIYPEKARRNRVEGEVQVCFDIDRQGRPYRIAVRNSSHRVFEKSAKLAVRASSWQPLGPDDEKSGIKTCRLFRFELERIPVSELN